MSQNPQSGGLGSRVIGSDAHADLLFAAIAASPVPSLLADPEQPSNPIVHTNRAFSGLIGYPEDALLGCELATLLVEAGVNPEALVQLRAATDSGTAIEVELEIGRKDGTRFTGALFVSPVRGPDGRPRYFFCSLFDIAGHAAASSEARRAKLADLQELARSVGHEFNNLLTIIHTNLELLRQAPSDAPTEKRLGRVALGVDRATELVRGFVAKVRGGTSAQPALPRARGGETILVVEPDEVLGVQAGSMLRGLGYQVETVASPEAGLRWLAGPAHVHLVLARWDDRAALAEPARLIVKGLPILYSAEPKTPPRKDTVSRPFHLVALARAARAAIDGNRSETSGEMAGGRN
jgi:PAS domain S-box-containing protein